LLIAVRCLRPPVFCAQEKVGAVGQAGRWAAGLRDGDRTVRVLKVGRTTGDLTLMINHDRIARSVRPCVLTPGVHTPAAGSRRTPLELDPLSVDTIVETGAHGIGAAPSSTGGAAACRDLAAELGRSAGGAPGPGGGEPHEGGEEKTGESAADHPSTSTTPAAT
jgi:hypothetical protein